VIDSEIDTLRLLVYEKSLGATNSRNLRKRAAVERLTVSEVAHGTVAADGAEREKSLNVFEEAEAALRGLAFKPGDKEAGRREAEEEEERTGREYEEMNRRLKVGPVLREGA